VRQPRENARARCRSSSRALPVATIAGVWLCTSCRNEAAVKKIDETKNVTASAVGPTADA
jgi:ribosomal protein L37AE/L43A